MRRLRTNAIVASVIVPPLLAFAYLMVGGRPWVSYPFKFEQCGTNGFILPGMKVNLVFLETFADRRPSVTKLGRAKVGAVTATYPDGSIDLDLMVTPWEALRYWLAKQRGEVRLTVRPQQDDEPPPVPEVEYLSEASP